MPFIGKQPAPAALTSSDITDGIISVAKLTSTLDLSSNTVTLPSGVGGKVLQVVSATHSTQVGNTANSYIDTGLTGSITPSSTSNKILVVVQQSIGKTAHNTWSDIILLRDSTQIGLFASVSYNAVSQSNYIGIGAGCSFLDTPSSTSSLTYKTQFRNVAAAGTVNAQVDNGLSSITLMEIAG